MLNGASFYNGKNMERKKREIDYSKEYLDGKFGAIPVIKQIIDWDEVWKNRDKYLEEWKGVGYEH